MIANMAVQCWAASRTLLSSAVYTTYRSIRHCFRRRHLCHPLRTSGRHKIQLCSLCSTHHTFAGAGCLLCDHGASGKHRRDASTATATRYAFYISNDY